MAAIKPFVQHNTEPVCLTVSEKGEVGETGRIHEYLVWLPEKQELQFNTLKTL